MNNVSNLGKAMQMYLGDYDEHYMPGEPQGFGRSWDSVISVYLGRQLTDAQINASTITESLPGNDFFVCPDHSVEPNGPFASPSHARSYSVNGWRYWRQSGSDWGIFRPEASRRQGELSDPSDTIVFAEYQRDRSVLGCTWYSVIVGDHPGDSWYVDEPSLFHRNDQQNYGFADGHVEFLARRATFNDAFLRWKAIRD